MARELEYLGNRAREPEATLRSGTRRCQISERSTFIEHLLPQVDEILIGGAMACTFFVAMGLNVGKSLFEPDRVDLARRLLDRRGRRSSCRRGRWSPGKRNRVLKRARYSRAAIPSDLAVFDIDLATAKDFAGRIGAAGTVLWNGPMGVAEVHPFDAEPRPLPGRLPPPPSRARRPSLVEVIRPLRSRRWTAGPDEPRFDGRGSLP